jgi:hypothetical protein
MAKNDYIYGVRLSCNVLVVLTINARADGGVKREKAVGQAFSRKLQSFLNFNECGLRNCRNDVFN